MVYLFKEFDDFEPGIGVAEKAQRWLRDAGRCHIVTDVSIASMPPHRLIISFRLSEPSLIQRLIQRLREWINRIFYYD